MELKIWTFQWEWSSQLKHVGQIHKIYWSVLSKQCPERNAICTTEFSYLYLNNMFILYRSFTLHNTPLHSAILLPTIIYWFESFFLYSFKVKTFENRANRIENPSSQRDTLPLEWGSSTSTLSKTSVRKTITHSRWWEQLRWLTYWRSWVTKVGTNYNWVPERILRAESSRNFELTQKE